MTEETTREQAEAAALEEGPIKIDDELTLRTFTSQSFQRCLDHGIRIAVSGQEAIEQMDGFEVMREAAFIGWLQSAPRAEVSAAISAGKDAVWDAVDEWEEAFNARPNPPWKDLIRSVAQVVIRGKLLTVKIIQTETAAELSKNGEAAPPN